MSVPGQSRGFRDVRGESALAPTPDVLRCRNKPTLIDGTHFGIFSREIESDFSKPRSPKRGGRVGVPGLDTLSRAGKHLADRLAAIDELRRHGDPWGLTEELPEQGEVHSTPKGY